MSKNLWMILAGLLLITFGVANTVLQARQENSPFDMVDSAPVEFGPGQGFVPVVAPAEDSAASSPGKIGSPPIVTGPAAVLPDSDVSGGRQPGALSAVEYLPDRFIIQSIGLDAPIVPTSLKEIKFEGNTYYQWIAPYEFAAGWHDTSALLGKPGNTVLNGHHNAFGEVFKKLVQVKVGDVIQVYSGERVFSYKVTDKLLIPERFQKLETRIENSKWIATTEDERLTLITCWPYVSNTHRLIVIALPINP